MGEFNIFIKNVNQKKLRLATFLVGISAVPLMVIGGVALKNKDVAEVGRYFLFLGILFAIVLAKRLQYSSSKIFMWTILALPTMGTSNIILSTRRMDLSAMSEEISTEVVTKLWRENKEVISHVGKPLAKDRIFFAVPSKAIGEIISYYSSMKKNEYPNPQKQLGCVSALVVVFAALALWASFSLYVKGVEFIILMVIAVFSALAMGLLITQYKRVCSFVGEKGFVEYMCKDKIDKVQLTRSLLFAEAKELRVSLKEIYMNGVYSRTEYKYTWSNDNDFVVCRLQGSYGKDYDERSVLNALHEENFFSYNFAVSAEHAWTAHLFIEKEQEIKKWGYVHFPLTKNNWVRVGLNYLEFCFKGQKAFCESDDIESISVHQGVFTITRRDAEIGWFSSSGQFKFVYKDMANSQLFLHCLDKLVGFSFS